MDGYLVMLSCAMDDFPLLLTNNEHDAVRVALCSSGAVTKALLDVFDSTGAGTPICTKVLQFSNGLPISVRIVKDFCCEYD